MQVCEHYDNVRSKKAPAALVMGGVPEKKQLQALRAGAQLMVATPGRLEDFLGRRLVDLQHVSILVLDEADRMLDMGFLPSIRRIVGQLPQQRQTMCFSATLEASVAGLVNDYLKNPVRIALGSILKPRKAWSYRRLRWRWQKSRAFLRELLYAEKGQTLIFARTKRGAERLAKNLVRDGFAAAMIHGDRSQAQRIGALNGFDEGRYKVLVATDVASRGLDVNDVAHVINYDLPAMPEDFIHRVGRTGRAGACGRASTLVSGVEVVELRHIERILKLKIARKQISVDAAFVEARPTRNTLSSRTLFRMPGEVFV